MDKSESFQEAEKEASEVLTAWFQTLKEKHEDIMLHPWLNASSSSEIVSHKKMPTNQKELKTYFNKLFLKKEGGQIYFDACLSHFCDPEHITDAMETWLMDRDGFMRLKPLQSESTTELGWFLYSTREMNATLLRDQFQYYLGFPFSVR